jgi:hypothetical protein
MSARRNILSAVGLLLGLAAACVGYYVFVGPGRYAEFEDVQARFLQMPEVRLVDASGHEDVTFEIDGFTVDVEGRGAIAFGSLDRESFESTDHLPLRSIGGFEVIVVREGLIGVHRADTKEPIVSTGWGGGIDVGPKGTFSRFFPFSLVNVQGVLDRNEEICNELSSWPIQPEYGTFQGEDGTTYYYSVKDPSLGEDWIYPSELEERANGTPGR